MMGDSSAAGKGVIPRLVESIFSGIAQSADNIEFTVKLSYVEIYNERLKDLLSPSTSSSCLKIREGPRGVYIENVAERYVSSMAETIALLAQGTANRAVASTLMNAESSRSHSVFILTLGQADKLSGSKKASKLTLTDLAGSEKVLKTGAAGSTLDEAKHINKSLSALGNVINALSSRQKHVPYRDSKLTRLLSDSLGGNSKTCLIVTCSPMSCNLDETVSTLRFGIRAKLIKNKPTMNAERSVTEYRRMLDTAEAQIALQQELIVQLEADVTQLKTFITDHHLTVPVLSGTSGQGIAVRMAQLQQVEEEQTEADRRDDDDDDEADSESRPMPSSSSAGEEHKEKPPAILPAASPSRRVSQTASDLSSLPSRLALVSSQLSDANAERERLLDSLADRAEEMREAEEIHRTEKELILLQVKELVAVVEEERRGRVEGELVKRDNELLRRKLDSQQQEHELLMAEVREERRQLQEKLSEVLLELQRRQQDAQPQPQPQQQQDEPHYHPPVRQRQNSTKDDLDVAAQPKASLQPPAPSHSPLSAPLSSTSDAPPSPSPLPPPAASLASSSSSTSHISPVLLRKHQRMKSQTLRKGDLAHPLALQPPAQSASSPSHARLDSIAHLSSQLLLLQDDQKKVTTLTEALSKKCHQYLMLKEAHCNSNDHIAMLEMALADANAKIKEQSDGQRGRIQLLEKKLAEAETLCAKLLMIEKQKRGSGQLKEMQLLNRSGSSEGASRSGGGGTIVVPVKQKKSTGGFDSLF